MNDFNEADIYITSNGLRNLRGILQDEYKDQLFVKYKKAVVPATTVSPVFGFESGFGLIGRMMTLDTAYEQIQKRAEDLLQEAEDVITSWQGNLKVAQSNWRKAEEANRVTYI